MNSNTFPLTWGLLCILYSFCRSMWSWPASSVHSERKTVARAFGSSPLGQPFTLPAQPSFVNKNKYKEIWREKRRRAEMLTEYWKDPDLNMLNLYLLFPCQIQCCNKKKKQLKNEFQVKFAAPNVSLLDHHGQDKIKSNICAFFPVLFWGCFFFFVFSHLLTAAWLLQNNEISLQQWNMQGKNNKPQWRVGAIFCCFQKRTRVSTQLAS